MVRNYKWLRLGYCWSHGFLRNSPSRQIENSTSCCTNSGGNIIGDYEDYISGYVDVYDSYGHKYSLSDVLLYGWNYRWNVSCRQLWRMLIQWIFKSFLRNNVHAKKISTFALRTTATAVTAMRTSLTRMVSSATSVWMWFPTGGALRSNPVIWLSIL